LVAEAAGEELGGVGAGDLVAIGSEGGEVGLEGRGHIRVGIIGPNPVSISFEGVAEGADAAAAEGIEDAEVADFAAVDGGSEDGKVAGSASLGPEEGGAEVEGGFAFGERWGGKHGLTDAPSHVLSWIKKCIMDSISVLNFGRKLRKK
jgi:hypothetical protein